MVKRIGIATMALLAAGAASAAASVGTGATATLSSRLPAARNITLTIQIQSVLECGRLQAASIQVRLPREMHVPAKISRAAVRISGQPPAAVHVSRTVVTLDLARPGITCFTMRPGTVAIRFGRTAGLRNPAGKGSYDFTVVASRRVWLGSFTIR